MFALAAAQLVTVAVTLVVGYFAAQNPDDLPGVLDKIPLFSLGQSMVEHFQKLAEPGADYIRRLQEALSIPPPVMEKPFDFTRQCPVGSHLMLSDLFTCDRDSVSHAAPASGPGFLESLLAPLGLLGHQKLQGIAILLMVLYLVTKTIVIIWRLTVCGTNILAKRRSKSDKGKSRAILLESVERDILDASQATAATDSAPVVHPVPVTAISLGPIHVDPRDAPPEEPFTGVPGMAAQIIERFNAAGASVNTSSSKADAKTSRKVAASRAPYGKGKEYLNVTAALKENAQAAPKIDKGKGRAVEPVEQDERDGKSQKAGSSKAKTGIPHIAGRPYRPSALRNVTNAPGQDTD